MNIFNKMKLVVEITRDVLSGNEYRKHARIVHAKLEQMKQTADMAATLKIHTAQYLIEQLMKVKD